MTAPLRIVGIDLGTTYSAIAYVTDDGRTDIVRTLQDNRTTPSVVFVDGDEVTVGEAARDQSLAFPDQVVSLVKRQIGKEHVYKIGGKEYTPQTISGHILKKLKEDAERVFGHPVTDAVITVPAYFGLNERKATEDAGVIAGLNVRHIISEPTAAAIAFAMANPTAAKTALVYDLGGGTFDVTLLKIRPTAPGKPPDVDVVSCGGNPRLGGADWDRKMVDHVVAAFKAAHATDPSSDPGAMRDLQNKCERAKQSLATATNTTVTLAHAGKTVKVPFDRDTLLKLTQCLLDQTETLVSDLLAEKGYTPDQIDEVLLVGGSTKLVMVREMLEQRFGKAKVNGSLHPDLCVAEGAAWYGHLLGDAIRKDEEEDEEVRKSGDVRAGRAVSELVSTIRDVCPFALGIQILTENRTEMIHTLIYKDQKLPCDEIGQYFTVDAGAEEVHLRVFENKSRAKGEMTKPAFSRQIAEIVLGGLPPGRPANQPIRVTYQLDAGFRLKVTGVDVNTGRTVEAEIDYASAMSKEEVDAARRDVAATDLQS